MGSNDKLIESDLMSNTERFARWKLVATVAIALGTPAPAGAAFKLEPSASITAQESKRGADKTDDLVRRAGEQLEDTRAAMEAFDRQAAAAEEADDSARKALSAANRPWIAVQTVIAHTKLSFGQDFGVSVSVINSGREPALQLRAQSTLHVQARDAARVIGNGDCPSCPRAVLAPSSSGLPTYSTTLDLAAMFATQQLVDGIENGSLVMYVVGDYFYEGSQGDKHRMSFCVTYDVKNNSFPFCDAGNTAD